MVQKLFRFIKSPFTNKYVKFFRKIKIGRVKSTVSLTTLHLSRTNTPQIFCSVNFILTKEHETWIMYKEIQPLIVN